MPDRLPPPRAPALTRAQWASFHAFSQTGGGVELRFRRRPAEVLLLVALWSPAIALVLALAYEVLRSWLF